MTGSSDGSVNAPQLISLLLPTYGRPALAARFLQSVVDRSAHPEAVEVILYVDDDDAGSHHLDHPDIRVDRIIGPRLTMGGYNSRCLERSSGEIIILVNDDMVIRTQGWDEQVRSIHAAFPDGIYLAYGNDLFKGGKLCTFPILSRHTCDLLGEPYPTAYRSAFIDYHLFDIFKRLQHAGHDRIRYLENLIFEHLHYRTGKATIDETYRRRGRFDDDPTFLCLIAARQVAARRLMQALRGNEREEQRPLHCRKAIPSNPFAALAVFTKSLLLDRGLPWRWRSWLWLWFFGRYLAANGWLRPFVR
ncbi:MAG: glycosyltransferase family 2 protein [Candidatus Thiosymbion ectosymbiont of Robbea hypermnestra]|nr:glycosyltransferase family 2 protein [Candidatus Thiosymbion ectosymbiont of Robbea hypermnestra]